MCVCVVCYILGLRVLIITERAYTRGVYDKFPDFFRMGTFIDRTHMKL